MKIRTIPMAERRAACQALPIIRYRALEFRSALVLRQV